MGWAGTVVAIIEAMGVGVVDTEIMEAIGMAVAGTRMQGEATLDTAVSSRGLCA